MTGEGQPQSRRRLCRDCVAAAHVLADMGTYLDQDDDILQEAMLLAEWSLHHLRRHLARDIGEGRAATRRTDPKPPTVWAEQEPAR